MEEGDAVHDALVRMVNALENSALVGGASAPACLNQVYDKAKSNPTETELNNAIDHFDEVVETFTTDRENILNFERMKVDVSDLKRDRFEETRRSDAEHRERRTNADRSCSNRYTKEVNIENPTRSTSESEEDGDGDGSSRDLENSEIAARDEFGTVPTMSPLLQTVSGQVVPSQLTKRASRIPDWRGALE